jgi:hypothetical protein
VPGSFFSGVSSTAAACSSPVAMLPLAWFRVSPSRSRCRKGRSCLAAELGNGWERWGPAQITVLRVACARLVSRPRRRRERSGPDVSSVHELVWCRAGNNPCTDHGLGVGSGRRLPRGANGGIENVAENCIAFRELDSSNPQCCAIGGCARSRTQYAS